MSINKKGLIGKRLFSLCYLWRHYVVWERAAVDSPLTKLKGKKRREFHLQIHSKYVYQFITQTPLSHVYMYITFIQKRNPFIWDGKIMCYNL